MAVEIKQGGMIMEQRSQAQLVSYNVNNAELCASAARISTTKGNAVEIFEKSKSNEKNQELIQKVLRSGHQTIIEHAVFTFALNNVSAFVEQFFIECRLASFTVKSRRYVDFSGKGYFIPPKLEGEDRDYYCQYMDTLFLAYQAMLENGIPKEDARFLLPYSFHSNFYCTLNAREMIHIICDMKHGRGKGIPELQDLADQIIEQAEHVFPCIRSLMDDSLAADGSEGPAVDLILSDDEVSFVGLQDIGGVQLLNEPLNPAGILHTAYRVNHPGEDKVPEVHTLLRSARPRELEQISYSFLISNITLSGITHMVRHRMQSVLVPSIREMIHSKFVLPDTIRNDAKSFSLYRHVLELSNDRIKQMGKREALRRYSYYFALSGNVMNILTTMNARELGNFIRLRSCNRAQWEIRKISIEMLKYLRHSFPGLFHYYGPSCFTDGQCPEGRMSCGRQNEVVESFMHLE